MTKRILSQEELVRLLPFPLQLRLRSREAFYQAYTDGFIAIGDDGGLLWMANTTVLAYFCGRLWCGDQPKRSGGGRIWSWGQSPLPAQQLERLFGVRHLRQRRFHNKNRQLDEIFLIVDNLFVQHAQVVRR